MFVAGLWASSAEQWLHIQNASQDRVLEGMRLGGALTLADGMFAPLLSGPIDEACFALPAACLRVVFDRIADVPHPWLVAQGGATAVGLYGDDGKLVRTMNIRSPRFLRDGSRARVDGRATTLEAMTWGETNSTVWASHAFGEVVATVHGYAATRDTGREPVQFAVFMNLHAYDGTPLVSDIRLPELPVGRDDSHLLFIDWGPAGRRAAFDEVDLVRVPVQAGDAGFVRSE